jgi:hypothetical protein
MEKVEIYGEEQWIYEFYSCRLGGPYRLRGSASGGRKFFGFAERDFGFPQSIPPRIWNPGICSQLFFVDQAFKNSSSYAKIANITYGLMCSSARMLELQSRYDLFALLELEQAGECSQLIWW